MARRKKIVNEVEESANKEHNQEKEAVPKIGAAEREK